MNVAQMMKVSLTASMFTAAALGVLVTSEAHADQFVVKNLTNKSVISVYVSHSSQKLWGPNLLRNDFILPYEQLTVYIPDGLPCYQDIRAVMLDGEDIIDEVNICNGSWTLF